jgi:predicted nucleic-acid-binding Zn-ribbon protein
MGRIPLKCPKCGRTKAWKEEINPITSGVPTAFGRVRGIVVRGLFAKPMKRAMGCYKVTYRCHNCGFREEFDLSE